MQPERFAPALLQWIRADGHGQARSFADAGYTNPRYGVHLLLPSGASVFLQTVGRSPDSVGKDADPDPQVHGPRPPRHAPVDLPDTGPTALYDVERWIAWRITEAQPERTELAAVRLFQDRRGRRAIPHGLELDWHSGARAWIYFRHATPAGREPAGGPVWRALPTV